MNLKTPYKPRNDGSALTKEDIQQLTDSIKGRVVTKSGAAKGEYEAAVKRWNEVYIKEANFVVYVEDESDVAKCIDFVEKHNIDLSVAGGRHSYHGASSSTGFVIDLQKMRKVSVDKASMTITAQGGCIARDLEEPAEAEGLSVGFGVVNETGIGGLTLGGGVGYLTGRHGLASDNLLSARVVLANGDIVNASEKENADLFWALRGGGGNFGVVTEFKFQAHEQGPVFFQTLVFSPDKIQACVSLANKMHAISVAPEVDGKLQPILALVTPPGSPAMCPGYLIFYDGPEEEAKNLAKPVFDLEPMVAMGGVMPYSKTTVLPPAFSIDGFDRYTASSAHMDYPVDEGLLMSILERFQQTVQKYGKDAHPSKCIIDLRNYQKMASVPTAATAFSGRHDTAMIAPDFQWDDPSLDTKMREEVTALTTYIREELQKKRISAGVQDDGQRDITAVYPNLSSGDEKSKSVFGSNLPRLQELKKKFDPGCLFDKWHPITPA